MSLPPARRDRVPSPPHRRSRLRRAPPPHPASHAVDGLRGLVAGGVAGVAASAVMNGFQALTVGLVESGGEPATEKAADRASRAATGHPVRPERKAAAGDAVHYAFGAAIGAAYGATAERWSGVTAAGGTVFGMAAALLFDEIAVPALGLAAPLERSPPAAHAYAIASHLVFGMTAEAVRRLLRG